ncbi:MAG: DNA repair protein RecN [Chitinophagaceae bacterium]|nr:MAG: DNA repair protein RecN [Chitinophagaceae bacterium]
MLQKLWIRNYAIIEELEINFSERMNCITGETGAGKSIIAGALGLILGNRADSSVLINKEKKLVVEGTFSTNKQKAVKNFLQQNDFVLENELVLRREIAPNGKSRAFINDTPVNLNQLQELSFLMVDLHQQFDGLQVGENDFQRDVLDALAKNIQYVNEYQEIFSNWKKKQKELDEMLSKKLAFEKDADYNKFQYEELAELDLKENELEDIEVELRMLNNAESIKTTLTKIYFELKENETPIVQHLKILANELDAFSSVHQKLPNLIERLYAAQIELQDIADTVNYLSNEVHYDQQKVDQLNNRLSLGFKLLKKHGVKKTDELLQIQQQLEEKLQVALNIDESIQIKEKEVKQFFETASNKAKVISSNRTRQAKPFEVQVNKLLARVGMPNAIIHVEVNAIDDLNIFGSDKIEFLFDANKSGQLLSVGKVASGGELNRLMLCIKSLVAEHIDLPTLIFDEIDTGISGEAAKQVGIILKELSANRQVICITHQPQIAGKSNAHFFVYKENSNGSIKTNIRQLDLEERINTIATMLSGDKPTAASIENARELVSH